MSSWGEENRRRRDVIRTRATPCPPCPSLPAIDNQANGSSGSSARGGAGLEGNPYPVRRREPWKQPPHNHDPLPLALRRRRLAPRTHRHRDRRAHPVFCGRPEESLPPEDGGRPLACSIPKVTGVEWVFGCDGHPRDSGEVLGGVREGATERTAQGEVG